MASSTVVRIAAVAVMAAVAYFTYRAMKPVVAGAAHEGIKAAAEQVAVKLLSGPKA